MPTLFSRIIDGELPGRFVYRDDRCVAFLTIEPLSPGHTLVVPIVEVDHWIDLDPDLAGHLMVVAQKVGGGISEAFSPSRIAMIIAGLEVPHVHLHVFGFEEESDLDFGLADRDADPADLDEAARRLTRSLQG